MNVPVKAHLASSMIAALAVMGCGKEAPPPAGRRPLRRPRRRWWSSSATPRR